jgi:hypothetical protein
MEQYKEKEPSKKLGNNLIRILKSLLAASVIMGGNLRAETETNRDSGDYYDLIPDKIVYTLDSEGNKTRLDGTRADQVVYIFDPETQEITTMSTGELNKVVMDLVKENQDKSATEWPKDAEGFYNGMVNFVENVKNGVHPKGSVSDVFDAYAFQAIEMGYDKEKVLELMKDFIKTLQGCLIDKDYRVYRDDEELVKNIAFCKNSINEYGVKK